jgi:hypothetical protein
MPLVPTPARFTARLKLLHAWEPMAFLSEVHSSYLFALQFASHNTEGPVHGTDRHIRPPNHYLCHHIDGVTHH